MKFVLPAAVVSTVLTVDETFATAGHDMRRFERPLEIIGSDVRSIPAGHAAAGGRAWLFADEIVVNPP